MLTVLGTIAYDTLARVKSLAEPEATGGVLDVLPDAPGGTGGNVASALARLGAPVRLVAGVGEDFAGSAYEAALARAGIDLSGLVRLPQPCSRAYIFFEDSGRQMTYFYPGASRGLAGSDVRVSGRVHFAAGEISAYPDLMRQADWVSFDPGQETFHRELREILECLPLVDLLFVNRHELRRLHAEAGMGVRELLDAGVGAIVETSGAEGAVVHADGREVRAPSVPVAARDPTGAGDAHRAGFLFALERGAPWDVAARFASVLGSFAVETVGAQTGLPTLDEALGRYEKAFGARPFS